MQGLLHSLQIGTLSTWLSLTTFGTVGVVVDPWHPPAPAPLPIAEETEIIPNDFVLEVPAGPVGDNLNTSPAEVQPPESGIPETLPDPPELAPLAELEPLPEIPDLPPPSPQVSAVREAPRSSTSSSSRTSTPRSTRTQASSSSSGNSSSSSAARGSGGGNSAATTASRLAAGRMPAPSYPASAKRAGQTGTVIVEFTIGSDGRVVSAYAKSASPWPALNEAAVRAVRRWKFPPGPVQKTQRPIVFQLR